MPEPETDAPDVAVDSPSVGLWRTPPRRFFNAGLAVVLVVLLWSASFPGTQIEWFYGVLALVGFGIVWTIRLFGWATSKSNPHARRWIVAPAMVVLTLTLMSTHVPLRVRFELARSDFDEFVEDLRPQGDFDDWVSIDVPDSLGSYDISIAFQVGDNVIIYEATGFLLDNAGFAYLPHGPQSELASGGFEAPSFVSLGGDWYAWIASW